MSEEDIGSLSVSGLQVASGKSYKVLAGGTQAGAVAYTDRTYKLSTIPSAINGATFIRTANDDKNAYVANNSFLTFTVNTDAVVYVAHDDRVARPSWLNSMFSSFSPSSSINAVSRRTCSKTGSTSSACRERSSASR